jgi:hypothetical protein
VVQPRHITCLGGRRSFAPKVSCCSGLGTRQYQGGEGAIAPHISNSSEEQGPKLGKQGQSRNKTKVENRMKIS